MELFGPAAAGKTTLSRALETALESRGIPARVVSSARPAEEARSLRAKPGAPLAAPLRRASRLFGALAALLPARAVEPGVPQLMNVLPPSGGWIRSLRLRRYLLQLDRAWSAARASDEIVIFDQGFVTLIASLALFAETIDRAALARAVGLIPKADLLVCLETPRAVIEARLLRRLEQQGAFERLFENRVERSLHQIELASALDSLLETGGTPPLRLSCLDRAGLASAVEAATGEIVRRHGNVAA